MPGGSQRGSSPQRISASFDLQKVVHCPVQPPHCVSQHQSQDRDDGQIQSRSDVAGERCWAGYSLRPALVVSTNHQKAETECQEI